MSRLQQTDAIPTPILTWIVLCVLGFRSISAAEVSFKLESFEAPGPAHLWTFSRGPEFPGSQGSFDKHGDAAHSGNYGGKLDFDFSLGGNYVAAILKVPEPAAANTKAVSWNALRVWLKVPEGHDVNFRYTDAAGQTFQRPVSCPPDEWTQTTIPFRGWTGSWGGPNDGKVRGPPVRLALLIGKGLQDKGTLLFDDLQLVVTNDRRARITYSAYSFLPEEGWRLRTDGNPGNTRFEHRTLVADFSRGARRLSLQVPERVLWGEVERISMLARGSLGGVKVRLVLRTHFMTFTRNMGSFVKSVENPDAQEISIHAPPGEGWTHHGGENDGKIHGPLRLASIEFEPSESNQTFKAELIGVNVTSSCPERSRCILSAESFEASEGPLFRVTARALTDKTLRGELQWIYRDWDGHELGNGRQPIELPAFAAANNLFLPSWSDFKRRSFVEADISLRVDGQDLASVRAAWTRMPNVERSSTLEPDSPFGMGLYLNRYSGDREGLALMERAARMGRDCGVKWSREDFSWSRIEPARGRFEWAFYDNLVNCAQRNGITVYAIAAYWSGWTKPYTPEGIEDYLLYLREMVKRYKGRIKHWEIWNEPNIFFWQGPKEMYAELLTRSYKTIKDIDSGARVLGLSTAGIDHDFIKQMLNLNTPFDILTIHPYRAHLNDVGFIKDLKHVSDLVRRADGSPRPVWLTEMGWATYTPHNTVRQSFAPTSLRVQAELIARSYLCAIVSDVDPRTFWYNFRNDGTDPVYFEHQMGIVRNDFTPKPAYVSFATLTSALSSKRLVGPVAVPEGVLAYKFQSESEITIAAWSPGKDAEIELALGSGKTVRVNTIGEEVDLQPTGSRVRIHLRKGAPVYLVTRSSPCGP